MNLKKKTFDPDAWKLKIDPDFNIPIRSFLNSIRQIRDCTSEGYLTVREDFLPVILDNQSPRNYDEMEELLTDAMDVLKAGVRTSLNQNNSERLQKGEDAKQELLSMTVSFSESSKKYYSDKIDLLFKGDVLKPTVGLPDEKRKKNIRSNTRELGAIVFSLLARNMLDAIDEPAESADDEFLSDPASFSFGMSCLFSLFAQIAFRSTIEDLMRKGDDKSLLKAVKIDKGLVYSEKVKQRVSRANLSGDVKFLKKLGEVVSAKPLNEAMGYFETYLVLRNFWMFGLCKLNLEELYHFLVSCGVEPSPPDYPDNLDKFLTRNIRPLYRGQV